MKIIYFVYLSFVLICVFISIYRRFNRINLVDDFLLRVHRVSFLFAMVTLALIALYDFDISGFFS